MNKHKRNIRKWHINQRIFFMLIFLMIIIFVSVFFAFNIFIRSYIRTNVDAQLSGIINDMPKHFDDKDKIWPDDKMPPDDYGIPDLSNQPKNKVGAKGEVFFMNADYSLPEYIKGKNKEEISSIVSYLEKEKISLENAKSVFVKTKEGEYYISTTKNKDDANSFIVYYVNVSILNNLVNTINISLGIILVVALLFCLFIANTIANSITTPVKEISKFSREIGKGNFARNDLDFRDIEFNDLVTEMNETADKLEKYDSEQKTFFQNVSHELRTPLMSIRCYAEGVAYGLMDAEKSGATIITETDRLSALVEDLLYISRIDSSKTRIEMSENDLRETISMAASALQPVADKKSLTIEYKFDDNPIIFSYNENYLYRAVLNLLSNAIRYAKSSIIIGCEKKDNIIKLYVKDDGEGILEDELPHIFERFYKGLGGKHGVGLSIVKSVAELHNGVISVKQNGGTSFEITFDKSK